MIVEITKEMIKTAVQNANNKLKKEKQIKKVYDGNNDKYLLNNIVGELGELAFSKSIEILGYQTGLIPHEFGLFMNSDICDMFSSKTAKTIDVKTTKGKDCNLLINKKVGDWKDTYVYVLVNLHEKPESVKDIYEIKYATIAGSMTATSVENKRNVKNIYGREVYIVKKCRLTPIEKFIKSHFFKKNENIDEYNSEDFIYLEIDSLEKEMSKEFSMKSILKYKDYNKKQNGFYNMFPMRYENKIISLAIKKGKFYPSLLLKTMLHAETIARKEEKTLIIPDYIQNYLSEDYKLKFMKVINNMKCNVKVSWKENAIEELIV